MNAGLVLTLVQDDVRGQDGTHLVRAQRRRSVRPQCASTPPCSDRRVLDAERGGPKAGRPRRHPTHVQAGPGPRSPRLLTSIFSNAVGVRLVVAFPMSRAKICIAVC